jgi:hypothetical protein
MGTTGISMLGSMNGVMHSMSPSAAAWANPLQALGSSLGGGIGSPTGVLGSVGMGNGAVAAGVGRAASLGALSVPQSWASAAPAFNQVGSALPASSASAAPAIEAAANPGNMLPPPLAKPASRATATPKDTPMRLDGRSVMPRSAVGG